MDDHAAAEALIAAGRRLGARGLISAGEGNLSVRLDADRLLMTPTGLRKDELVADDLVVVWPGHPDREARSPAATGHRPTWPSTWRCTRRGPISRPSPTLTCRHR